jgi:hypothetical protein
MTKNKKHERFDDNNNAIWNPNRKSEISKEAIENSKRIIVAYENSLN